MSEKKLGEMKLEQTGNNRDYRLDAVKGLAILIVMLGHCIVLNGMADPYFYDAIVAIQMPLFMAVSGYALGMRPVDFTQRPDGKKLLSKVLRRTGAYLIPFFFWLILTHLTNPFRELGLQLFALDRGLWFLMTLWIVMLVVTLAGFIADCIAYRTNGNGLIRFLVWAVVAAVLYLMFILQGRSGNTFLSPSLTVKYLPFYAVGYLWAFYLLPFFQKKEKKTINILGLATWLAALVLFLCLVGAFDMIVVTDSMTLLAQMLASFAGCFLCFYGIYRFCKGKTARFLSFIGQFTLEIYVLHFRFARILGLGNKGLSLYSLKGIFWIIAAFLVMSILTALCIFLIKKIAILDFLLFGKRSELPLFHFGKKQDEK